MNVKLLLCVSFAICAFFIISVCVLVFYTSYPSSEVSGIVKDVSIEKHNDILLVFVNGESYYVNRGIETGLNIEWMIDSLPQKNVQLQVQRNKITEMYYNGIRLYPN